MKHPRISVCIATYNGARFIEKQILSAAAGLSAGDEIVVSDDGSTDATLRVLQTLSMPDGVALRVVRNPAERGYVSNFENAMRLATGDVLFLCDQDDIWHADKVEKTLRALETADFVVSDADVVDDEGKPLLPSFLAERQAHKSWAGNVWKFGYLGCCMAFRRTVLRRALPFPSRHDLCTHDNWLYLVARTFYKVEHIPEPLISYRRHAGNASQGGRKLHKSAFFRLQYRFYLMWKLLERKARCSRLS